MNFTDETVGAMFCDPFYCLEHIDKAYCHNHEPLVSEEEWIWAATKFIEEIGPEEFLNRLLKNLKGMGPHWKTSQDN